MTELPALAGSEGYAACDDEAQCRIVRQRRIIEAGLHCPPLADNRGFPMSAIRTHWERRSSEMTELSALAESEGYAACDDDGGLCCQKKAVESLF